MDTFEQARKGGLAPKKRWDLQLALIEHVASTWREPDYGIWETSGPQRHFTYSKVMAWIAFDRAIKAVERHGLPGPVEKWRATARRSTPTSAVEALTKSATPSARPMTTRCSMRACCCWRRSASSTATIRVSSETLAAIERDLLVDG